MGLCTCSRDFSKGFGQRFVKLIQEKNVDSQRLDKKSVFGGLVVECLASDQYKELAKKWNIDGTPPNINATINATLNNTQRALLELLHENNVYTYDELASRVMMKRKNVYNNLKKLQELGLIRRVGARKNGHWEVLDK